MDDDLATLRRQLGQARTEGERARLRRLIDGEPEPRAGAEGAAGPAPADPSRPNDQVLADLIRGLHPPREAPAAASVEVSVHALRQLIEYARYGDTLRWHRMNHVPELTPLERLKSHMRVTVAAMAARREIPRMTGKDWFNHHSQQQSFADRLAESVDTAFVVADRIKWRGGG
jgi:hypothetical protein